MMKSNYLLRLIYLLSIIVVCIIPSCKEPDGVLIKNLEIESVVFNGNLISLSTIDTFTINKDSKLTLNFSSPIPTASANSGNFILQERNSNEQLKLSFNLLTSTKLEITPGDNFPPNTNYIFKLGNDIKSIEGATLSEAQQGLTFSFKTENAYATPAEPSKPEILTVSSDSVAFTWSHNGDYGKGARGQNLNAQDASFGVLISTDGVQFQEVPSTFSVKVYGNKAIINDLLPDNFYYFKVFIKNSNPILHTAISLPSERVKTTSVSAATPPEKAVVQSISQANADATIRLQFAHNSWGKLANGSDATANNSNPYKVELIEQATGVSKELTSSQLTIDATQKVVGISPSALEEGTTYVFVIVSTNNEASTSKSNASIPFRKKTNAAYAPPESPSKPQITSFGQDSASFTWSHNGDYGKNMNGQNINAQDASFGVLISTDGVQFQEVPSTFSVKMYANKATVTKLVPNSFYYFKVFVKNNNPIAHTAASVSSDQVKTTSVTSNPVNPAKAVIQSVTQVDATANVEIKFSHQYWGKKGDGSNAVANSYRPYKVELIDQATDAKRILTPTEATINVSQQLAMISPSALEQGKTYLFIIISTNDDDELSKSNVSNTFVKKVVVNPTELNPDTPFFTARLGEDPETQIVLSWANHSSFGKDAAGEEVTPANPAYKVEISTDGQQFSTLPSGSMSLSPTPLVSTEKSVTISGLVLDTDYWIRVSASNTNTDASKQSTSYTLPQSMQTIKKEVVDNSQQSTYAKEEEGAPARPTWIDGFRYYWEQEFLKKGRYVLMWRKDPGTNSIPAKKWDLIQILFKNPTEMATSEKFGQAINPQDIDRTVVLKTEENIPVTTKDGNYTFPANLLPPNSFSTQSSEASAPKTEYIAKNSQVGYFALNSDNNSRQLVVAYKVRVYADVQDTDDKGNPITKEVYNDGPVMFVNYKEALFKQVSIGGGGNNTGGGGSNGGGNAPDGWVPDSITTLEQVQEKLNLPQGHNFVQSWEDIKISGTTPLEQLITKADYEALFPPDIRKEFQDRNRTYYTWENLVEASRYFPLFLNEGTKEDKYRELAAFLGNKSHETGDGWRALGEKRWSYGLVWIVELSVLTGSGFDIRPENQDDLYKAYSSVYTQAGHAKYPGVPGKSYHGRGPVQLSWNYNYGQMSETLFGDKDILLSNPNLIARNGFLGWASALWFWMAPQGNKPSSHDVMVGNVDLTEPYTKPTSKEVRTARQHTANSKGHDAAGNPISYDKKAVPMGAEVGFGLTINIINGGLESNTGRIDNRHAKRIGFFARYLDYFGTTKNGRNDGKKIPISPQVGGIGGDPVPTDVVEKMKSWRNWIYLPADGKDPEGKKDFPTDLPSILGSHFQTSFF